MAMDTGRKKIVALTGAGMSAESGISTFRDSNGLWEQYRVEDVASIEGWIRNPKLVLDFYNARRASYKGCEPNEGHRLLAGLEKEYEVVVVTQNVDDLHERAGSTNIIHLHGELMKNCSDGHRETVFDVDPDNPELHLGDLAPDGTQLRPYIVWFGEAVPKITDAAREIETADIVLVIGTSLNVYPAAGLLAYAPSSAPVYLIDPKPVSSSYRSDIHKITAGASEGMRLFCEELKKTER
ncbi:NAD-dependent protein deacylase [Porphyromonas macacae]|uniref:NAD-dependent protein deacylase n=2 Tax=Porphyromonas macacae TaxID=28115 RepID=A0A0A2E7F6_9PORP|nr:NAD-dependent protein deacylase [Porphyromonas macacae]